MLYQIWTNFLVFFLAVTIAPGIEPRNGLQGYLVSGTLYVLVVLALPKVIEFFKLNLNIASFILVGGLLTLGYFFFMKSILFGFLDFESMVAVEGLFGIDFIGPQQLDGNGIAIFATILTTTLVSFNQWLMGKK